MEKVIMGTVASPEEVRTALSSVAESVKIAVFDDYLLACYLRREMSFEEVVKYRESTLKDTAGWMARNNIQVPETYYVPREPSALSRSIVARALTELNEEKPSQQELIAGFNAALDESAKLIK